jgi:hypothetical protein
MHDPEVYPNFMEFQPERFLGEAPAPDPHTLIHSPSDSDAGFALVGSWLITQSF